MIKGFKVKLKTNVTQINQLFGCVGVSRWAYNYALGQIQDHYKLTGKFLGDHQIRKNLTKLKKTEEFKWLYDYSNDITKQAIKDACTAYKRFFKLNKGFPKFKSKRKTKPSFYQDTHKIKFKNDKIKIEKVGWINLCEKDRIPTDTKYYNPRVTFDGIDWFVSVSTDYTPIIDNTYQSEGIGIDVGIKELAFISDGSSYPNINKTPRVSKVKKSIKRLQRQTSRKYTMNKQGNKFIKTKNIVKNERKIRKKQIHLNNIRMDYLHKVSSFLAKTKPEFMVIEDLNIQGMMKNRHLAKPIAEQSLFGFLRMIEYKCKWAGIPIHKVDRFFPSSKTCSACGNIKRDLTLKDRIYKCTECGYTEDRDLNAALNLKNQYREFHGNSSLSSVTTNKSSLRTKSNTTKQESKHLFFRSFL